MDDTARATGKTTRILLDTASAMSRGERVLIVTYTYDTGRLMNEKLLQILTVAMRDMVLYAYRDRIVLKNGGEVQFMARGRIGPSCSCLRGRTYNSFFSDVGELTQEELIEILPCIRSQSVVDIDITHFETGEEDELPTAKKDAAWPFIVGAVDEESQPAEPVKERTNARRVLSSR